MIADYEEKSEIVDTYADGYTMVSGWKWRGEKVAAGESAGLCVVDVEQANNASCWLLVKDDEGKDWAGEYSFSLDPALLTETFKLEDYINDPTADVSSELYEGFNGSWKFGSKNNDDDKRRDGVTSSRFLPSSANSTK